MLINPEDSVYEFIDPDTGNVLKECPFLKQTQDKSIYKCTIHDTKPSFCKNYPENGICIRIEDKR